MEYGTFPKKKPRPKIRKKKHREVKRDTLFSVFRFKDAEACTGNFSTETCIGKCLLGLLYKAILKDGSPVVVKRGLSGPRSYTSQLSLTNELRILSALQSDTKSFTKLIGFSNEEHQPETLLMLQYPARGTLYDVLHRADPSAPPLCFPLRIHIAFQAAKCLKVLHYRYEVVHRDLRSGNLWIDKDWNVKLANFGVAIDIPWDDPMPECPIGCLGILDPDWPVDEGYLATKVDVFCFGLLLAEIISNRKVFDVKSVPGDVMDWVLGVVRKNHVVATVDPRLRMLPDHLLIPRELGRIAAMCLQPVCRARPTMSDIVERLRPLSQKFPFRRCSTA